MNFFVKLIFTLFAICIATYSYAQSDIVAGAADLRFALDSIYANFQKDKSYKLKLVYGSSGLLAQQINSSAPYGMFMSADEAYIFDLERKGLTKGNSQLYAVGRIVLMQKKDKVLNLAPTKDALIKAINQSKKIAIANPEHAPYGRAAKEFFTAMGVWELAQPKLVFGENIGQATNYIRLGAADFGVSALSLAKAPSITSETKYVQIPNQYHQPLNQRMVLLKNSSPAVTEFYQYIGEPNARSIFESYGFILPK